MEETNNGWLIIVLIIISVWFWRDHHKLTKQVGLLQEEIYESQHETELCNEALSQANENIEDAKSNTWSSYDDMGYALETLETVEP